MPRGAAERADEEATAVCTWCHPLEDYYRQLLRRLITLSTAVARWQMQGGSLRKLALAELQESLSAVG